MITIYSDLDELERLGIKYIKLNDAYFNVMTQLEDTPAVRRILKEIDKAEYVSAAMFSSREKGRTAVDKNVLSTGAKTLLNIAAHPDVCFSVIECGNNCMNLLVDLSTQIDGMIYAEDIELVFIIENGTPFTCDISYCGKRYTDYGKVFNLIYYDEEEPFEN